MKDSITGVLALGDHLIDKLAVSINEALESDWFWIALVVLIATATFILALAQIAQATA